MQKRCIRLTAPGWIATTCIVLAMLPSIALAQSQATEQLAQKTEQSADGVDEAAYALPELKFADDNKPYVVDAAEFGPEIARWVALQNVTKKPQVHPDQPQFAAVIRISGFCFPTFSLKGLTIRPDSILSGDVGILQPFIDDMISKTPEKLLTDPWAVDFLRDAGWRYTGSGQLKALANVPNMRIEEIPEPYVRSNVLSDRMGEVGILLLPGLSYGKQQIVLLAPTKQKAQQLAKMVLTILNYGQALPARRLVVDLLNRARTELAKAGADLPSAEEKVDSARKAYAALRDEPTVNNDTLKELTTKRVLLSVERAGVAARVSAAEKLLAGPNAPTDRTRKLVALKEAAEIEMAGLAGQLAEIDKLIDGTSRRSKASIEVEQETQSVLAAKKRIESANGQLGLRDVAIKATAPVELLDKAIAIRPVQLKADAAK